MLSIYLMLFDSRL